MRPIKADLDKALMQPWSNYTCILAQCLIRHGREVSRGLSWIQLEEYTPLMHRFDDAYAQAKGKPIDWEVLRKLREELPESDTIVTGENPICEKPKYQANIDFASLSGSPNLVECVKLLPSIPIAPTPSNFVSPASEW